MSSLTVMIPSTIGFSDEIGALRGRVDKMAADWPRSNPAAVGPEGRDEGVPRPETEVAEDECPFRVGGRMPTSNPGGRGAVEPFSGLCVGAVM